MKTMILFAVLLTSFAGFSASENAEDVLGVRSAAHMTGAENCDGMVDYTSEIQGIDLESSSAESK
jgi:hypothetical protein